jgi:hypothetical protein
VDDSNVTRNFKHAWYDGSDYINVTAASGFLNFDKNSGTSSVTSDGSFRAPIFYDSNNTAYYADPGATSQFNGLTVTNTINGSISGANAVNITGYGNNNFTFNQTSSSFNVFSGWHNYLIGNHGNGSNYYNTIIAMPFWGSPRYSRLEGGTQRGPFEFWTSEIAINSSQNITAPIYYDYNNTGYYLDPASTSNLNALKTYSYQGNGNVGGTGDASWHPSGIYSAGMNWLYGGINGGGGSATNFGDVQANIFYDYNNTAYYTNPAGTSNLNALTVGGSMKVVKTEPKIELNSTTSQPTVIIQAQQNGSTSPPMGELRWDRNPGSTGMRLIYYNGYTENSLKLDGSNFKIVNNGSERMRINSSGKVGIGTTNPLAKLHIESTTTQTSSN